MWKRKKRDVDEMSQERSMTGRYSVKILLGGVVGFVVVICQKGGPGFRSALQGETGWPPSHKKNKLLRPEHNVA